MGFQMSTQGFTISIRLIVLKYLSDITFQFQNQAILIFLSGMYRLVVVVGGGGGCCFGATIIVLLW